MAKKFPLRPAHPERICWGCDLYCNADAMKCGNGSSRSQHPIEMLGDDWYTVGDWAQAYDIPAPAAGDASENKEKSPNPTMKAPR